MVSTTVPQSGRSTMEWEECPSMVSSTEGEVCPGVMSTTEGEEHPGVVSTIEEVDMYFCHAFRICWNFLLIFSFFFLTNFLWEINGIFFGCLFLN